MAEKPNPNSEEKEKVPETPKEETPEEAPKEGLEGEGTPEETTPPAEEPKPEGGEKGIDYKKRYADSTREYNKLVKELIPEIKELRVQVTRLSHGRQTPVIEPPSTEELSKSVPDWDLLSPTEQMLLKEQIFLKRKLATLESIQNLTSGQLQWEEDFGELTRKPEFKGLLAKKNEFKYFCDKNPGASIEILAQSFLFDEAKDLGAEEEKEKLERKGLEKGSGGVRTPKAPGLSWEELEKIQKENPLEYQRLIKKGLVPK